MDITRRKEILPGPESGFFSHLGPPVLEVRKPGTVFFVVDFRGTLPRKQNR